MKDSEPLSPIEASFVALERPGLPMHVAGVVLFRGERPLDMDELAALAGSRLRGVGRFHQRLRTPYPGARPVWEPAGRMRYASHLFHHELPAPGHHAQLHELCGAIHAELLDRERPLWEMHLVDGLSDGRQALLVKTHHALTDGLAGVEIARTLFDPAPGSSTPDLPVTRFIGEAPPSPMTGLQGLLGLAYTAAGGPLAADGPFNGPVGAKRSFGMATLPMPEVRRIKRRLGANIDDVVVATVTAGIRAYLHEVEYPAIPRALRAMLPVSMRGQAREKPLRNHVSAIFVDLPMDVDDMTTVVRRITDSKATLRAAHAAAGGAMAVELAAMLPSPLHAAVVRIATAGPFAHLVLSDIPGPDQDLYVLGRRITGCYPMIPLPPDIGLSIACLSMNGVIGIGVTADPSILPDAQRLARSIERALGAFEAAPSPVRATRRAA